jgi:hypothetical protein
MIKVMSLSSSNRAIAQVVSHWLLDADAWVQSQDSPLGEGGKVTQFCTFVLHP